MSPQDEIVLFHHYTLFVDEAGDDKVDKLKPLNTQGNSEWLCLGGYLIRSEDEASLERRRNDLWTAIFGQKGRPIHYRNLKDFNRLRVCKALAQHSARAFVVCSFKETMVGHENHRAAKLGTASSSSQYFYNFVVRLLLERVTEYVAKDAAKHGLASPKLNIVLASRKGHHFGHFKAYVLQLKRQGEAGSTFLNTREVQHKVLEYDLVHRRVARQSAGLKIADIVVSSMFQAIERASPKRNAEPAMALKPIIAGNRYKPNGKLYRRNVGLTLYPPQAQSLITNCQKDFFRQFGFEFEKTPT